MSTTEIMTAEWVSLPELTRLAGITKAQLPSLLRQNRLTLKQIPGCRTKVLKADVDRLVAESIRPAVAGSN